MAYRTEIFCPSCKLTKVIVDSSSGFGTTSFGRSQELCYACQDAKDKEERIAHFANLDSKSIEERIRLVEEWIYDYKPTHVQEPRF